MVQQTGVKETVGIYTNGLISSPLLVGFFHPSIMLPTTQLSASNFRYTILHELIHCKRRDIFYKWLVQFTVCLHWFNPLVYVMSREINRICELSCDEAVIGTLDMDGRRAYGNTLLHVFETGGSYKESLASVPLSEGKEQLKERLEAIMNFKKKTLLTTIISTWLALALCFGASAAGAYTVAPQVNHDSTIIDLSSDGRGSITQSGSFEAREHQTLMLTVQSNIQGGAVNLILFSPDGKEQRIAFNGSNTTESIALSSGRWSYNCTGFF